MTLSNLAVKAAGLFFKIPLTSLIGEEGMGYFNSAYTIFTWLYMLSCAGLPTASSMLIAKLPESKRQHGASRILKISLILFTSVGTVGAILMVLLASPLSHLMRVENAAPAMVAVAPTLFFICQSAALRGYFQGFSQLAPHSVSQVVEAFGKLILGVALANYAVNMGHSAPKSAAFAALGVTAGVMAGTVVLYVSKLFYKKVVSPQRDTERVSVYVKKLVKLSFPITLSSSVMSLAGLLDSFIMTRALHHAGASQAEAAAVWGNYSSLALPMFNLPPVLTLPIAYALLPALSSAVALRDKKRALKLTSDAVYQTVMFAVPCAVGMSSMSGPILRLLFDDDIAKRGELMLSLLAPASMLLCLVGLTNTVLQASGHERVPLFAMVAGAVIKLVTTFVLTPVIGKFATPISTFLCYLCAAVITTAFIAKKTPLGVAFKPTVFILPLFASALSCGVSVILSDHTHAIVSISAAALIYFGIIAFVGRLTKKGQGDLK